MAQLSIEMEAEFVKKAKIMSPLVALASFVLSAGAYISWKVWG